MEYLESDSVENLVKVSDWLIECMGGCGRSLEVGIEYPILEQSAVVMVDGYLVVVDEVQIMAEIWRN